MPLLAGCAHGAAPGALSVNPAGFPFFPGSSVLVVRSWRHELSPSERAAFGIVGGGGAYQGHEVVTATQASFDQLVAWLRDLSARPPDRYRVGLWGSGVEQARGQAYTYGLDFAVFDREEDGTPHEVAVIGVDPALLQSKAGFVLSMLGKFRYLPQFLRAPIDEQAREQTGFTVSEALDPTTPIGAAIDALGRLNEAQGRGVVYLDARRVR